MPFLIDAHEDLAYSMLTFGRDYRHSAVETRRLEFGTDIPTHANGDTLLGWEEYQRGQVALVFSTLFLSPARYQSSPHENQVFRTLSEAYERTWKQVHLYRQICDESPEKFRQVLTRRDLSAVLAPWQAESAQPPRVTHPVGLVMLMEGAEGVASLDELEEWWLAGVRMIGPVWAGTRLCGGMYNPGRFSREGLAYLDKMHELGFALDIAHMSDESVAEAFDRFDGTIIASHANARALLNDEVGRRHLPDTVIRLLAERDGVIGVMPFNRFLVPGWKNSDRRELVTLEHLAAHIDHICQVTGSARYVAFGSDFDGGFGYPAVPLELNTIADLQKMAPLLAQRGYSGDEITMIFGGNWQRILERILPA